MARKPASSVVVEVDKTEKMTELLRQCLSYDLEGVNKVEALLTDFMTVTFEAEGTKEWRDGSWLR